MDAKTISQTPALLRRVVPLGTYGATVFAVALYLIVDGIVARNGYALFVGAGLALVPIPFFLIGSRVRSLVVHDPPRWLGSRVVYSGLPGQIQRLSRLSRRLPLFFRVHYRITGRLSGVVGGFSWYTEVAGDGGSEIDIPLYIPVAGTAQLIGTTEIRDVFGLWRWFVTSEPRSLSIVPGPLSEPRDLRVVESHGADQSERRKQSEEDKFMMREYVPGDRSRDINWKSSARLRTLLTRISPYSIEQSPLLTIVFRAVFAGSSVADAGVAAPIDSPAAELTAHLEYAKRWCFSFIKAVRRDHPQFQFRVAIGNDVYDLDDEAAIDAFGVVLGALDFRREPDGTAAVVGSGDLYVFSTAFDSELFAVCPLRAGVRVFRTERADTQPAAGHTEEWFALGPTGGAWFTPDGRLMRSVARAALRRLGSRYRRGRNGRRRNVGRRGRRPGSFGDASAGVVGSSAALAGLPVESVPLRVRWFTRLHHATGVNTL